MSGLFFFLKPSCSRYSASFVVFQSSNWGGREPRDESSHLGRGREEWVGIQTGQETPDIEQTLPSPRLGQGALQGGGGSTQWGYSLYDASFPQTVEGPPPTGQLGSLETLAHQALTLNSYLEV